MIKKTDADRKAFSKALMSVKTGSYADKMLI